MATDPLLRDAVKAIKQKIQNVSSSASAEELAYLATAAQRIGGPASLLEMEELGDVKMAEFTVLAGATQTGVIAAIEDKRVSTNQSLNDTKDAANTSMTATKTAATTAINDTKTAAQAAIDTAKANAIAASNSLVLTPAKLFFLCQN